MLKQLDTDLLLRLNGWHNSFLDVLFYWMTHLWFWLPLLALLLWLLWRHYRKQLYLILAFFALSIVLSDQISLFIKNKVQRPRPTHNVEISDKLHLHQYKNGEVYRGGQYGFVSSHAANSFAVMVLFLYFFKPTNRRLRWIFPSWAVLFCYTRIYLGVHYPSDIICGALTGTCCGLFSLWLYLLALKTIEQDKTP